MKTPEDFYVGVLCFNEKLGTDLIAKLNELESFEDINGNIQKIKAEHMLIHEISIRHKTKYKIILDRRSHVIKQAIGLLMLYSYSGIHIINNPLSFYYFISNKDCGFGMMDELGVNVPKTYILPPHSTSLISIEDFKYYRDFDWKKMVEDIGFPCYIKPAAGRGAINVNKANDLEELLYFYNQSGEQIMTVQKAVSTPYNWQIRCLCTGRKIIPIKYIFRQRDQSEYIFDENFLTPDIGTKVLNTAKIINRAFGYEMNTVEFIIDENGVPWAIDFNNPVPDGRPKVLGEIFYRDYLNSLCDHIVYIAKTRPHYPFLPDLNSYADIARLPIEREEKYEKALELAKKYYEPI